MTDRPLPGVTATTPEPTALRAAIRWCQTHGWRGRISPDGRAEIGLDNTADGRRILSIRWRGTRPLDMRRYGDLGTTDVEVRSVHQALELLVALDLLPVQFSQSYALGHFAGRAECTPERVVAGVAR